MVAVTGATAVEALEADIEASWIVLRAEMDVRSIQERGIRGMTIANNSR
jgi:hypothetical protein